MRINEKDLAGAAFDAAEAVRLDPTMPYAYYLRGFVNAARGDRAAAYEDLRKALGDGGPNWSKRGEALRLLEQIAPGLPVNCAREAVAAKAFRPPSSPLQFADFLFVDLIAAQVQECQFVKLRRNNAMQSPRCPDAGEP